jgi:transposase-like protein
LPFQLSVDWPCSTIESIPPEQFSPQFCPRQGCPQHRVEVSSFRFRDLRNPYRRKCDGRIVRRFYCYGCCRSFSQQAFAVSYYLKRPELTIPIAKGVVNGAAHRQIARVVGCAPSTVTKRIARIGRHAELLHQLCLAALSGIDEPINYDDFETFTGTQFHPCGLGTGVGGNSWFLYTIGFAPHRRGGHLSPAQRKKQMEWDRRGGKPLRNPYVRALQQQLDLLIPRCCLKPLVVISDDMKAYARAIRRHPRGAEVRHLVFPNPKRGPKGARRSPNARARDAAMFPTDTLHGFMRHSVKMQARETIAFGRRTESQLERMHLFAVFKNLVKRRSERRPKSITPAMWLGLTDTPWRWERVFAQRLQPSRMAGGAAWPELYDRRMTTPTLRRTPAHQLKLAY